VLVARKVLIVGGVLSIADDFLKNNAHEFIETMCKIGDMAVRKEKEARREVQEAGGPYEDDYDEDGDEYYDDEDPEDSEEDEVCYQCSTLTSRTRKLPKEGECKKVVACFIYLQLGCLNNES
jgi:hypothetical protein